MGGSGLSEPDQATEARPHESPREAAAREQLAALLAATPIPADELVDNLILYLGRKQLMDVLALDALYRMILDVPGVIMEFGTRWGRHLGVLTALRALHEPYNVHRRVIGFDTFSGFLDVGEIDMVSRHAHPGGLSVKIGYQAHLEEVLTMHESAEPLGHVRRTFCLAGDVRDTLPRYLKDNPQTLVGLAYFDLDLHGPTRDALTALIPYLSDGSVLAFDQIGHPKWPGETVALREVLGAQASHLALIPGFPSPVFMRWRPR